MIVMKKSKDGGIVIGDSRAMETEMMFRKEDSNHGFSLNKTSLYLKTQNCRACLKLKR